jgi:L-serine dehydratase
MEREPVSRSRSIFDIVGPVMIGPSSSHTAGAARLGLLARAIFGEQPAAARIRLHGSFATTGPGHGTDLALAAGLLGYAIDDARIRDALADAAARGVAVTFEVADLGDEHPNTAAMALTASDGRITEIVGSSLGGAEVVVTRIDDFDVEITGELPTLVVAHVDQPGVIAGVTQVLAASGANIATMSDAREKRGERALMLIETDAPVPEAVRKLICDVPGVSGVHAVGAV